MKKYIIAFVATISLITVHQTVLSEGWDWFGAKTFYDEPYLNPQDVKETAIRAAQEGQYGGRRETALYAPLVIGAAYAGHKGWQAVRNWYRGPAKTMQNKLEHIKRLIRSDLIATTKHIEHQEKSNHKDAPSIVVGLRGIQKTLTMLKDVFDSNH